MNHFSSLSKCVYLLPLLQWAILAALFFVHRAIIESLIPYGPDALVNVAFSARIWLTIYIAFLLYSAATLYIHIRILRFSTEDAIHPFLISQRNVTISLHLVTGIFLTLAIAITLLYAHRASGAL